MSTDNVETPKASVFVIKQQQGQISTTVGVRPEGANKIYEIRVQIEIHNGKIGSVLMPRGLPPDVQALIDTHIASIRKKGYVLSTTSRTYDLPESIKNLE